MIFRPAALLLALGAPSAVGAADPHLRENQPHRSLRLPRGRGNGQGGGRGSNGRGQSTKLGASGCTVLEKVNLCKDEDNSAIPCPDGPTKRQFACEDLETGAIYDIDTDMEELARGGRNSTFAFDDDDAEANLLESAADDFVGDADIDLATGRITLARGRFGKSKNPRGRCKGAKGRSVECRRLQQTGDRRVVVLNVESSDGHTTGKSNGELADSIFGSLVGGSDQVNLASQYSACSHGKLNFKPQPDSTSSTSEMSDIQNGVASMISTKASSEGHDAMRNDATNKLRAAHGYKGGAEYVMVCLPAESMKAFPGVAYAYINSWLSVYSAAWCTVPSAQLHEVGHNLGLSHAGEGGIEYGDTSGFMGIASYQDEQRKCFSGPKTYKLGWFIDRHVELTAGVDSFDGRLYGFTQYAATTASAKMIIRINDPSCTTCDWYISFNHQAGFNQDTGEGRNQVQLHTKAGTVSRYVNTYVQARLSAGASYTVFVNGHNIEVEVGEINTAEGWAQVSVRVLVCMKRDDFLLSGESLTSPSGFFKLWLQADGNLVLRGDTGGTCWSTGTGGHSPGFAKLQRDGNFLVRSQDGAVPWETGRSEATALCLLDSGKIDMRSNEGKVIRTVYSGGCAKYTDYLTIGSWRLARVCEACSNSHFSISSHNRFTSQIFRDDGTTHPGPRRDFNGWDYGAVGGPTYSAGGIEFGNFAVQVRDWRIKQIDRAHLSVSQESGEVARIYRADGTVHGSNDSYSGYVTALGEPTCAYLTDTYLQVGDWRFGEYLAPNGSHLSVAHRLGNTAMIYRDDGTFHSGPRTDFNSWTFTKGGVLLGSDEGCESSPIFA